MPGCSTCIERATDLSWLSPAGKPPLAYGEKLVQKRSAIIILLIVVAAAGVLVYLTVRSLQQEVHLTASPNILTPRKAGATAEVLKTSPMREGAYSENEYARLRQRYKPRPPAAEGPLSGFALQVTEKAVRQDLYPKDSWPLVKAALSEM
jgi:hypothetical protein